MEYYIGWIVGYIISCVIFGFITKHVANSKGYSGGFAWGFWLGLLGLLVVGLRGNKIEKEPSNSSIFVGYVGPAKVDPEGGAIPLYEQPNENLKMWIPGNTDIQIVESVQNNGWIKVSHEDTIGFVKTESLITPQIKNNYHREHFEQVVTPKMNQEQTIDDKLRMLAKLHNDGLLTDEEFNRKKTELIERI